MSVYEDRVEGLRDRAQATSVALEALPIEQWGDRSARRRTLDVLAYTLLVVQRADPALVSERACNELAGLLSNLEGNAQGFAMGHHGEQWVTEIIERLPALSASPNADLAREAKEAAASFQRSAQTRLSAVGRDVEALREEFGGLQTQLHERADEFSRTVQNVESEYTQRLHQLEEQARAEQTALVELRTKQGADFERIEEERRAAERVRIDEAEARLKELQTQVTSDLEARVAEIRRMEEESSKLVGAIGLAGTAERYGEEVKYQRKAALIWEVVTVVVALTAIGPAVYALHEKNPEVEHFVGKIVISLIIGGVAAYTGAQARHHRAREKSARDFQLELTAFSPFIEPLTPDHQESMRVWMTRRIFGRAGTGPLPLASPALDSVASEDTDDS